MPGCVQTGVGANGWVFALCMCTEECVQGRWSWCAAGAHVSVEERASPQHPLLASVCALPGHPGVLVCVLCGGCSRYALCISMFSGHMLLVTERTYSMHVCCLRLGFKLAGLHEPHALCLFLYGCCGGRSPLFIQLLGWRQSHRNQTSCSWRAGKGWGSLPLWLTV